MFRMNRKIAGGIAAVGLLGVCAFLAGCEVLALAGGKGMEDPQFVLPKDARVLVLVDVQEGVSAPPLFTTNLGTKIGSRIFHYKGADNIVAEDRLLALQQDDPEKYKGMSIAQIAVAMEADVVVYLHLSKLDVPTTSDGSVTWGDATGEVKVVNKAGLRLWPGSLPETPGTPVKSHLDQGLSTDHSIPEVYEFMSDQLALRTAKMFHAYSLDDKEFRRDHSEH